MKLAILVAALCVFPLAARATSGSLRDPGSGYAKLYATTFSSGADYSLDGTKRDGGLKFVQKSLGLYGEYGLVPHLALATNLPLLRVNAFSDTRTSSGIGDVAVELKLGTVLGAWHGAIAVGPEIPTGRSRAFVRTPDGGSINLPTGDGEWNVWTRAAISRGIDSLSLYVSADIGYNFRTKNFTDQYGFSVELGHNLLDRVWLSARLRGLLLAGKHPRSGVPFLYGEGTEYLAIDAGVAVPIAGGFAATLDYTNVAAARKNV